MRKHYDFSKGRRNCYAKRRRNPSGEWWIDESGHVEFADGDIGSMGHEAIVAAKLTREFLDRIDSSAAHDEHVGTLSDGLYEEDIVAYLTSHGVSEADARDDPVNELYKLLVKRRTEAAKHAGRTIKDAEQFEDAFWIAASGPSGRRDARVYAMKYDGWKRVQGNSVETWRLTQDDLKAIADGLAEINEQVGTGEEIAPEDEFYIEVRASKKYYTGVPWSAIDSGDLGEVTRGRATNPRRTNPPIPYEAPQLGGMRVLRAFRPVTQQHEHTCGPACLRAILAWNGMQVREADLAVQAKTTKRHGTLPQDMALTLTDHGRRVTLVKNTDLAWCLRQLRRDRAVLLLWNDWKGHWVTLIGYDPQTRRLLLADPANRKTGLRIHSYDTFAKHWRAKVAGTLYRRLAISVA